MSDPRVTLYSKDYCPYCVNAKRLLSSRGIPFKEINLEKWSDEQRAELFKKTGMRTVPQIFSGERLVGGYTELAAEDGRDQLAAVKEGR
ncbi:MAG: glutathione S-transferase N-terminal domain-containing protein [Bdellovibrionales bacterium]|nr:glutathione S-transferase N-terminal domain-containing protein [Bdellovibrionales bacterium]